MPYLAAILIFLIVGFALALVFGQVAHVGAGYDEPDEEGDETAATFFEGRL